MATVISGDTGVSQLQDGAVSGSSKIAPGAVVANNLGGGTGAGNLTTYTTATTPLPANGGLASGSHSLGVIPIEAVLELTCITAEQGYSTGDVAVPLFDWNGVGVTTPSSWKTSTTVAWQHSAGSNFVLGHKTTAVPFTPTAANWSYRFRLRAA